MNAQQRLIILKRDLQLLTDVHDEYLKVLMEQGQAAIEREGIVLTEGDVESDMAVVQYAAYLFRKRAGIGDASMPRFLRYQLNNMLFSQKGRKV